MTNLNEQMEMFENTKTKKDEALKKLDKGVSNLKEERKSTFDKMTKMLESGEVKNLSQEDKQNFVKLYKLLKQHHGFQQGGLEQDGGTQDPVSGNKVPIGSAQVEVRDDIPAMLSEGEFVFPADVVRFIGLEKLMQIRQEAKAGLKRMEDMGQMGNSSEATIPDDVPFTIDDLEVEDETKEMQVGGAIPPATTMPFTDYSPVMPSNGGRLNLNPNQLGRLFGGQPQQALIVNPQLTAPTSTPANMTNVNLQGQYGQAVQPLYSVQAPTAPIDVTAVGSDSFIGGGFGTPDEIKVYVTPDGKEQNIGFKGGQPLSPIPPGAVLKTDFTEPPKPKTTESARVKSASVLEEGEERKVDDGLGEGAGRIALGGQPSLTKKGIIDGASVFGVSYDIPGFNPLNLTKTVAGIAMGKPLPEDAIVTLTKDGVSTKLNAKEFETIKNNPRGKKAEEVIERQKQEFELAKVDRKKEQKAAEQAFSMDEGEQIGGSDPISDTTGEESVGGSVDPTAGTETDENYEGDVSDLG